VLLELGVSCISGAALFEALWPHFKEGTYDLLRKNCNSFSDAAIFYLMGTQLDPKYKALDRAAASMDSLVGLVQLLSMRNYTPNPKAEDFQMSKVMSILNRTTL
ncbi:unnamed protein product, partial [Polarella glacialis]